MQAPSAAPSGYVSEFMSLYGKRLLYALVAYMIFRLLMFVLPGFIHVGRRTPPPTNKETFHPREETHESWVRL